MALAEGESVLKCGTGGLTLHTRFVQVAFYMTSGSSFCRRTAIWVAEQLTDAKFKVEKTPAGHTIIQCQGIGYTARTPGAEA